MGAFHQSRDLIEQGIVFDGSHTATHFGGSGLQLMRDVGAAFGKAGDDSAIVLQHVGVIIGMLHHQRRHLGFEPVALGAVASAQSQCLDRHHGAAVQGDQAMRGAHKVHAAPAWKLAIGFQLILHDLGNRQLGQSFFQGFLQARWQ